MQDDRQSIQSFIFYPQQTTDVGSKQVQLLDFLSSRFPYLSRKTWSDKILAQHILINQQQTSANYLLQKGDKISYLRSIEDEPKVDISYKVLWQDDSLLVVDKNGNLPVSISGRYYYNTLVEIVKKDLQLDQIYPVHRIDKETSGIVVLAKNPDVARIIGQKFAKAEHHKRYHAVLRGELKGSQLVTKPIAKNKGQSLIHIRQICSDEGKQASTLFELVTAINNHSFAEITTYSGRTHQIRCHAEYINLPLLGDKLYGQSDESFLQYLKSSHQANKLKISRQLLHASLLSFEHPYSYRQLIFFSNPLQHFRKIDIFNQIFTDQHPIINHLQKLQQNQPQLINTTT